MIMRSTIRNLYVPDLTFLLTLPTDVMVSKIKGSSESISEEGLKIFAEWGKVEKRFE